MFGPEFAILKIPLPEEKIKRFCTVLIVSDSDMLLDNAGVLKRQTWIFLIWDTNRKKKW